MDEKKFLTSYDIHNFDVPLTTVDVVCFSQFGEGLAVLLAKRPNQPDQGKWSLPGGFIDMGKDQHLEDTARRKVTEKAGINITYMEQVETVGNGVRDPRGWSVTCLYLSLLAPADRESQRANLPANSAWVCLNELSDYDLAFDHSDLIDRALARLQSKSRYTSLPLHLLGETFTLSEAQKLFELVLEVSLEKKAFRRRLLESGIVEETGETAATRTRTAALYRLVAGHQSHCFPRVIGGKG